MSGLPLLMAAALLGAEAPLFDADLLIVGGTESGCAAAVQAARMGVPSIVLVNDIDWLGGQFSAEALGAIDENRARGGTNETPFPRSGLFREVTDRIEALNLRKYGSPRPGNAIVQTTCRPSDAEQVFRELLQPYVDRGQLRILRGYYPHSALMDDARQQLRGLRFALTTGVGDSLTVRARLTIDASDWGEALRAAGAEYEVGPDLQQKYGEPSAPTDRARYPTTEMNPITWCAVLEQTDRDGVIKKPARYDERRYYRELNLFEAEHRTLGWRHGQLGTFGSMARLYPARRLIERSGGDIILLNRPTQNYPLDVLPQHVVDALEATEVGASLKNIAEMSRSQREIVFADAKLQALGFVYFLQTAAQQRLPAAEAPYSFRNFTLSSEFGTPDRLPPKPYIRESLRMKALYMMREQDTLNHNVKQDKYAAVMYEDGLPCWQFEYDYHPTGRAFLRDGDATSVWECYFKKGRGWGVYSDRAVFPLRSLVPTRVDGLLGAQKNLGYSSLVCSAVRLHDQSMAIGQASAAVAAVCLRRNIQPREMAFSPNLLEEVRAGLCSHARGGVPVMLWPFRDVPPEHTAFEAINLLAARGAFPLTRDEIDFRPEQPATPAWREQVVERSLRALQFEHRPAAPPEKTLSRGEFASLWWRVISDVPHRPLERVRADDADGDGIRDEEDPLPHSARTSTW